jgi:aryl-alcohol dehydrogenase-like predicted oxidoreductase
MEHTRLGGTGLKVSRLALGCMSYGDPAAEGAHRWALADDEAQPFFPRRQRPDRRRDQTASPARSRRRA